VREAQAKPLAGTNVFYGIPVAGRGVVFVVDGSRRLYWPAAWAVQKTRYKYEWDRTRNQWEKEYPSHASVVARQLEIFLASADAGQSFGLVILHKTFDADAFARKMSPPSKAQAALRFLDKAAGDGWCGPLEGLFEAMRIAGVGPDEGPDLPAAGAETIVLLDSGAPSGGRYLSAQALVAAFERLNRFRRLTVHTVRTCEEGKAAEALMKGLAETSGGTYVWAETPP
jgi:hypothetical protein